MISFYPGPSKVSPNIQSYLQAAFEEQIVEYNHRSPQFMALMKSCISILKEKLAIPSQYQVMFTSSATECWEITCQSFNGSFVHVYNGAFGKKWAAYNTTINNKVTTIPYSIDKSLSVKKVAKEANQKDSIICLTSCETSNTSKVHQNTIHKLRKRCKDALLFVDATSSMSGVKLDWLSADIWYASVQKCFGLPSGLAIMVCSPKAIERMNKNDTHYNSLQSIYNNSLKLQTTHTPNILNIYLLKKVMEDRQGIHQEHELIRKRAQKLNKKLLQLGFTPLINTSKVQSETVIGVKCKEEILSLIKEKAIQKGLLLGNGYGPWKKNTFRIANFPSHTQKDFEQLINLLNECIHYLKA